MKKDMLKDILSSTGKISSMRWGFIGQIKVCWFTGTLAIVGSLAIGGYALYTDKPLSEVAPFVSALLLGTASIIAAILATANIGKAAQSHAEHGTKNDIQN